ncbi:hypothetical protein EV356DRAFT_510856 [Viridothelium virens]|uniref:Yeast cell wall synthesis Kre9/Knh1-like N-terminal domain-containing protein n=1 Tax=Viridothelium virens TaxID=1048519 RepID=A0A6A6GV76_VIRVR|nr:hypothetical protein EV356DRAFT_510856 [Viridothelium virens]
MRFLSVSLLPLLAALACAQGSFSSDQNPFSIPSDGFNATAGQKLTLNWSPTTSGTVSLVLRTGEGNDLEKGVSIASNIQNSGSYGWNVPSDVVKGQYTVEIVDDDHPDTNTNFTPFFQVDSDVTSLSASSSILSTVTSGAPTTSLSLSTVSPSSAPSNSAGTTGATASASGPLTQSGPAGASSTASTTSAPTSSKSVVSTAPGVPSSAASSLSSAISDSSASSAGSMTTSASSTGSGSSPSGSAGATASAASVASSAAAAPTQQAFGGMVAFAIAGVVAAM